MNKCLRKKGKSILKRRKTERNENVRPGNTNENEKQTAKKKKRKREKFKRREGQIELIK
jgi:hypothetical protein